MPDDEDLLDLIDLVENAPDLIQSVALDGRMLFANRAWRQRLGCGEQALDGRNVLDFVIPRERLAWRQWLEQAARGERIGPIDATLVDRDGRTVPVQAQLHGRWRGDRVVAIHGIFRLRDAVSSVVSSAVSSEATTRTAGPRRSPSRGEALASGPRVLVAEDNLVNQRIVRHLLEELGCHVTLAANGVDAVELAAREVFDLVIMDLQMPLLDGWDATRQIRARERGTGEHVPVIALTACAADDEEHRSLQAGMDGYLTKPVESHELAAILKALPCHRAAAKEVGEKPRGETLPFDLQAALSRLGNDTQILAELAEIFLEECAPMVTALESAIDRHDAAAVMHAAHRLKSCVANFFAQPTYEVAENLERQGREDDLTEAPRMFSRLVRELNRLRSSLRNLVERHEESEGAETP